MVVLNDSRASIRNDLPESRKLSSASSSGCLSRKDGLIRKRLNRADELRRRHGGLQGATTSLLAQRRLASFNGIAEEPNCTSHLLATQKAKINPGNKCGKCQNHEIDISKKGKLGMVLT